MSVIASPEGVAISGKKTARTGTPLFPDASAAENQNLT
jgi:hypothetical protein